MRNSINERVVDTARLRKQDWKSAHQRCDKVLISGDSKKTDHCEWCPCDSPQGDVNHGYFSNSDFRGLLSRVVVSSETGDVHFLGLFLERSFMRPDSLDDEVVAEGDDEEGQAKAENEASPDV